MMRNAGTKSKGIQIWIILSFLMGSFGGLAHAETEFVKYSDLKKPIKGDGSRDNPYQIAHPFHLKEMRDNLGSHFKLTKDLDLGENKNFKPIGSQKKPFEGTFDGSGKIIRNLKIRRPNEYGVGFFGYAQEGSVIRNVKLENIDIVGKDRVGGLVGLNYEKGTIETSYATGKVEGENYVGGLVGANVGMIETSYATGQVDGGYYVGGFVGWNEGTIQTSYATGKVFGKEDGVGGLVGWNHGTIQTSYAAGKVLGNNLVGGLVGLNYEKGTIETSYATGEVNGNEAVGGFVGQNDGTIAKSYAAGKVLGNNLVGGIVGLNGGLVGWNSGTIQTSYATGQVNGKSWVGGLVGHNEDGTTIKNSYATGKVNGKRWVGGLVGWNDGTIETSYATGKVEGKEYVGGLVGLNKSRIRASYAMGKVDGRIYVGKFVGYNERQGWIEGRNYWSKGFVPEEGIGENNGKVSHIESKFKSQIYSLIRKAWKNEKMWVFAPQKHPRLRWQSSLQ